MAKKRDETGWSSASEWFKPNSPDQLFGSTRNAHTNQLERLRLACPGGNAQYDVWGALLRLADNGNVKQQVRIHLCITRLLNKAIINNYQKKTVLRFLNSFTCT